MLFLILQLASPDTLEIRALSGPPPELRLIDSRRCGPPQVRIRTRKGTAEVWLLRARDTVFVAASIPDSTFYWGDDFVVSLDTSGDAADQPQHDDFQLYFRRVLDSSLVYRGRNGRWEPPRNDPDWRLGPDRAGGGWEVNGRSGPGGWRVLLRLDPAWFEGQSGRLPRIAFRIYDNDPAGWYPWPSAQKQEPPTQIERIPERWIPIR